MKQFYAFVCLTAMFMFSSIRSEAQCSCANGNPVDSLKQTVRRTGILPFSQAIPINKMDPSLGTLTCVVGRATVFTVVTIEIVNRDSTDRVTYQYNYTRTTSLTGPGLNVSASAPRIYGPFELGQAGTDPDTVATFGPDTMFNYRVIRQQTSSSLGSYTGTGTVNLTYNNSAISGFVIGNSNNQTTISDFSDVTIEVVYYFCPLQILSTQLGNFTVSGSQEGILLSWRNATEEDGSSYEVEVSGNGRDFRSLAKLSGKGKGSQQYNLTDRPGATPPKKLYYRLSITDVRGRVSYSSVKAVSLGTPGGTAPSIYPNPVTSLLNLQFPTPQTGLLTAELVGMNGQVLQSRQVNAGRLLNLQISLARKYPAGTYVLRVRNAGNGQQSISRVFIQ